ncbi:ABC transporter ATP-binding protein [Cytobacillus gottheilii]|uniref:ABC transporter ATP-binding protein n=1 Tax=Cytobacillus gottheilii TaxID=859144 RepID=UPI000833B14E|nr:ABC transporter ATP-binding protein [Cytobacillus gottheilii]
MIRFEDVKKQYDGSVAVNDLNFAIEEGEFFVLIGPSGCGKTTTLKMMNRLIDPSDGTILIDNKRITDYDIHKLRYNIGYVLQQIALFPHMTIEENIAIVPQLKKWNEQDIQARVSELLAMVGLNPEEFKDRKPNELSGGQQQRIGVARALAADPKLILMDEPFSALDPISREKLQDDLLELKKAIKKTIVFVTHDISEALKLGDRIGIMNEGKMVQIGTPEELLNAPQNEFVKSFIGRSNDETPINLEELLSPLSPEIELSTVRKIHTGFTIQELLHTLKEDEQVVIIEDDQALGYIDRQAVIAYLASVAVKGGSLSE